MRIDRASSNRTTSTRRGDRAGARTGGGFAKALDAETAAPRPAGAPATTRPVNALLSIQEVPDALAERRRSLRRGRDLLDQLEELRLGLMLGTLTAGQIESLAAFAAARGGSVDDPRLAEILNEIEIRAAVELAKLGR